MHYYNCKRGEADGAVKGNQTSPVTGRLADQGLVSRRSTSKHSMVDLTQSLGWIINQKSELKPTQVLSFVGYEYHLDSSQERWLKLQDLIIRLKSKHVLMSLIGLLTSMEKMVPEGRLQMRPFQFHLEEHWRFPQLLAHTLGFDPTTQV